jgi:hypothetical protein
MKTIQMYEANDGSVHDTPEAANRIDVIHDQCKYILDNLLPQIPEGCSFANGSGYLQCDSKKIERAKNELLRMANVYFKPQGSFTTFNGLVGRYISDGGPKLMNEVYNYLNCIDDQYRMWGQPYFRFHPDQAKMVRLN